MHSSLGIVEIPALAKVTWDLYNQCKIIAKDAPAGFQRLVTELGSLQGTLRTFADDVSTNTSFFEKMDQDRKRTFERSLGACLATLQRLKELLARLKGFKTGDGKGCWQKIKWATQRIQIEDIGSKIMVHTCNLSLCISSIGNASFARLEKTMVMAMEEDEQIGLSTETSPVRDTDSVVSPTSPGVVELPANNEEECEIDIIQEVRYRMSELANNRSSVGSSKVKHTSTSSESAITTSDDSLFEAMSPTSWLSLNTSTMLPTRGRINHARMRSEHLLFGGSIDSRTLDGGIWANDPDLEEKQAVHHSRSYSDVEYGHPRVIEAVMSAMQHLRDVRHQEHISRPIRFELQNQLHKPTAETLKIFEASINDGFQITRLITRDWLRVATWWLLKARATLANCNRHNYVSARGSLSPSTESRSTSHQAYLDLLKASYILYDIVLEEEASPALLGDEDRKSIVELSEGINEELSQYTSIDIPEPSNLHTQNLAIWEPMQPEETGDGDIDLDFGLDNLRWVAVDLEDAGNEQEKVLYRTFVNGSIGGKKTRMRTKGAPYMLLLATREGESEPKIVFCNQSGTLCLERDFVLDDLPPLVQLSNSTLTSSPGARVSEPVPFKFDVMSVSISFQFDGDLAQFINIPKAYFDAVWQREPVDAPEFTESVIFKSSMDMFEQLNTPTMKSMKPPVVVKSCEVRILERSFGEAWRSIRRMVITSSAAEKSPQTMELSMPLSGVQINRGNMSRQLVLQWSDTCQARSDKTDGNYNTLHSYVYDDTAPNIGVGLQFHSHQEAEDFEKAVLEMNFPSEFSWSQPCGSGLVYNVVDAGTEHKQYKSVLLFRTRASWRYSDPYYIYRDTDYTYDHSSFSIHFPRIYCTDYISTHVDRLYHPESPVTFSHCDKKTSQTTIEFDNDSVARSFLSSLSPLYELLYSRRVQTLSTKSNSVFGFQMSGKRSPDIQLWRRRTDFQLAARWDDSVPDKWLTMGVPSEFIDCSKENTRVTLPRLPYLRGMTLDMMNVMARSPKNSNAKNKEGAMSISFQTSEGQSASSLLNLVLNLPILLIPIWMNHRPR
ncbi:unnamed protein product [Penicillium nalgiovense]|uniref:Fungal N-terminal domain-containing protein n=1 Tax=Penicillium nalgiovense TaxID=60175 RepID=A0A9W4HNA7_PENNA|nr:unnamed protein product [Penicillium nalgiovense]CAG8039926.1 unnamed protein product [Penicillium nalgiovense]CAG8051240.1 unnamed protein product [Penicillium nalgiovense]CAG8058403.1 unnamed protein product [Penicillium nalgiovense]CAG8067414.1 unnamed protein product [Penicillium nalgiovense]